MSAPRPSFDFIDARRQQVRAADLVAQDTPLAPDDAAKVWQQGQAQGLAPALALSNPDDVRLEAERRRVDEITRTSPVLADWIAEKPERLVVAKDDLEGLSMFDRVLANMAALPGIGMDVNAYRSRIQPMKDRLAERFQIGAVTALAGTEQGAGEFIDETVQQSFGRVFGTIYDAAARQAEDNGHAEAAEAARGIAAMYRGADPLGARAAGETAAAVTREAGEDRAQLASAVERPDGVLDVLNRPLNAFEYYAGIGADSGASTLLAIATRNPRLASGVVGTAAGGQTYGGARAEGVAPVPAALEALTVAGTETALALSPFEIAFSRMRLRAPAAVASEAASEGLTEIVQGATVDQLRGRETSVREQLLQALDATVAGGATGAAQALLAARPERIAEVSAKIEASAADAVKIEQLHAIGAASKTLERAPDEVEALVRQIVDRTPDAPTHIYLDAEALTTYFQSASLDPAQEIGQLTGDAEALSAALAGGGDIVVPIARYVAKATRSPHADALKDLARLAPDRASNADLASLNVDDILAEIAPEAPAEASPVQQVAQRVRAELEAAGVEPSAAAAQAELVAQRYQTRAERRGLGEDALQVYEAAQLRIERAGEGRPVGQRLEQPPTRPDETATDLDPQTVVPVISLDQVEDADLPSTLWFTSMNQMRADQDGMTVRAPDGTPVRFSASNRKHILAKGRRNPLRQAVARALPKLVLTAPIHSTAPSTENAKEGFAYAAGAVQYQGKTYPIRLVYRIAHDGTTRAYDFEGFETTNPAEAGSGAVSIEQGPEGDTRGSPRTEITVAELRDAFKGTLLFQPADGGQAPRGRIILGRDGSRTIQLLAGADLSTFHHETGHLFLDELVQDAFTPGTPQQLRDDLDRVLAWWGVKARTAQGRDAVIAETSRSVNHEKFARGYEAYLREGKAPAPALADLMARFRTWLIAVYRSLRQLNIELTDEVRGVYDRVLATDTQIAAAKGQAGLEALPLPEGARELIGEARWREYEASLQAAAVEARQAVEQRLLAAQQREAQAWWKERRAEIEAQVRAEANGRADFQALSLLSRGKMPDGSDPPAELQGLSLSRKALVEIYGERFVMDRLKPLRVYRREGGVTPDAAAPLLGYPNGAALVAALDTMPAPKDWIAKETDRRLREAYPDPLLDGSLPESALEAVHNDRQLQALEAEVGFLAELAADPDAQPAPRETQARAPRAPRPPLSPERRAALREGAARRAAQIRALGASARQRIARLKRRDIRPNDYLVAERKAAQAATKAAAAGDYATALRHKRAQTVSAHLYRAAREATAEFDKARDFLQRFTRTDTRARLGKAGGSYLEQIDGLLELVEMRQVSGREVERRAALADWVAARAAAGEQIEVPDAVLALTRVTNLRDMPMEQVRGLVDTIKQIDHLARLKTKLMLGAVERDRAEVDAELAASVRGARGSRPVSTGDRTNAERFREAYNQGLGAYLRPSTLARDLDGFEDGGPVWTHTVGVIQDAVGNQLNPALQQAQEQLAGIWRKHYSDAELRRMHTAVHRPEVRGDAWSKARILSLALNWGNTGNREALLSQARKRLSPEEIGALLGTLDARDVQFVNEVWAFVDSFWPQIAETTRRRTGLTPGKVEASPFTVTLADGTQAQFTGGYFPLKYESTGDPKASQDEQTEFWDAIRTGRFAKAQTRDGHTKERVGSGGRTVKLEIDVLGSHVRDVLRDVHLGDAVNYVHHVLQGGEFRGALTDVGKLEYGKALELWLRDVATGEMAPRTWWERTGRKLRTNFTASLLGFNISSALIQPTGFLQTGAALGWDTLATGARRLLTAPWAGPNGIAARVDAASPIMKQRGQTSVEAVRKVERALAGKRDSYVMRHAWYMMARTQRIVDMVTWLGAEAKGLDMFDGDVAKARAYADDAVQRAQASGEFSDKSALERGTFGDNVRQSELVKGTTALMSYMIAKGNVVYERTRQTSFRDPRQVARLSLDLVSLLVIENLLIAVLRGGLPSDEDEDGLADDVALWFAKEGILGLLGTVPVIAQSATSLRGYDAQGVIERLSSTGKRVVDAAVDASEGEELTASDAKAAVSLAGMLTGLPAAQTNRTLDAVLANENGEDVAAHEYVMGLRKE